MTPVAKSSNVTKSNSGVANAQEKIRAHRNRLNLASHRHGTNFYVARTEAGLYKKLAEYCREYWTEAFPKEENPADNLTDAEIVSEYFAEANDKLGEFLEIGWNTLDD